jgi:hypothetical protein
MSTSRCAMTLRGIAVKEQAVALIAEPRVRLVHARLRLKRQSEHEPRSEMSAAGRTVSFCRVPVGKEYVTRGLPSPHIHGPPIFGDLGNGRSFLYIWPEKDYLKSFEWSGQGFSTRALESTCMGSRGCLAPPFTENPGAAGMPVTCREMNAPSISAKIQPDAASSVTEC